MISPKLCILVVKCVLVQEMSCLLRLEAVCYCQIPDKPLVDERNIKEQKGLRILLTDFSITYLEFYFMMIAYLG